MGAEASLTLAGVPSNAQARLTFRAVERDLARLERIFSLYDSGSQIVQLNSAGILKAPAPELLEVLNLCGVLNAASMGAFDPTLQPLWLAYAKAATQGRVLSQDERDAACAGVGWGNLQFDADQVRFDDPNGGLTLNGIAQGYVTDQIAKLLRRRGFRDILVDMGEIAVLGKLPSQVGIVTPGGDLVDRITLQNGAIATSAPMGTMLDPEIGLGHILDARDDKPRPKRKLVSVSARTAAVADGLSTAFCLMARNDIQSCLAQFPGAKLEVSI